MKIKTIGLASDHAGYELKQFVKEYLAEKGYEYKDFGTDSEASCDYADFAHPLAEAIETGECYPGIAICGSGEGINMTLNKHQGIRAGLSWIPEIAHLCRQHNDANVLVKHCAPDALKTSPYSAFEDSEIGNPRSNPMSLATNKKNVQGISILWNIFK